MCILPKNIFDFAEVFGDDNGLFDLFAYVYWMTDVIAG
jgi:hypothetical protein